MSSAEAHSESMAGLFVVLEGIDGAGKSTLARALRARVNTLGVGAEIVDKRADGCGHGRLGALRELIWGAPPNNDEAISLGSDHHLLLHAAWYAGVSRAIVEPARRRGSCVIADSWWGRSAVKAILRDGLPSDWAASLFATAAAPDLTVFLDLAPEVAWARRQRPLAPWELGRWDGFAGPPKGSFCAYQNAIGLELREAAAAHGWHVIRPHASWSPDRLAELVLQRLSDRRPEQVAGQQKVETHDTL